MHFCATGVETAYVAVLLLASIFKDEAGISAFVQKVVRYGHGRTSHIGCYGPEMVRVETSFILIPRLSGYIASRA